MPEIKSIGCKVFEHNSKHMGLNIAIIPKKLLEQFREIVDSDPVYIEIRSANVSTLHSAGYLGQKIIFAGRIAKKLQN